MSLRTLVATWSSSQVHVAVRLGEHSVRELGSFTVERPSARTALTVLAVHEGLRAVGKAAGSLAPDEQRTVVASDQAQLRRTVSVWLGPELTAALFAKDVSVPARMKVLQDLLAVGLPMPEQHEKEAGAVVQKLKQRWDLTIAEYRATYSAPDPLSEPWPFFVSQAYLLSAIHERYRLRWIGGYAAVKTGDQEALGAMQRAAFPEHEEEVEPGVPEWMSEDWQRQQLEKAQAYQVQFQSGNQTKM